MPLLKFCERKFQKRMMAGISRRRGRRVYISSLFLILFYPLRGNLLDNLLNNLLFLFRFEELQTPWVC